MCAFEAENRIMVTGQGARANVKEGEMQSCRSKSSPEPCETKIPWDESNWVGTERYVVQAFGLGLSVIRSSNAKEQDVL